MLMFVSIVKAMCHQLTVVEDNVNYSGAAKFRSLGRSASHRSPRC